MLDYSEKKEIVSNYVNCTRLSANLVKLRETVDLSPVGAKKLLEKLYVKYKLIAEGGLKEYNNKLKILEPQDKKEIEALIKLAVSPKEIDK